MDPPSRMELSLWISLSLNVYCLQGYFVVTLKRALLNLWNAIRCKQESLPVSKSKDQKSVQIISRLLEACETQVLGWLAMYLLILEAVPSPFSISYDQSLRPVMILLSIHMGKLCHKMYRELCVEHQVTKALYYMVHCASFFTFLFSGSNAYLGLIAMVCEISDFYVSICKVLELSRVPMYNLCYLIVIGLGIVFGIVFRAAVPVVALCSALQHSNPLFMDNLEVVMFFFYLTFLLSINLWFIIYSLLKLQEHLMIKRMHDFTKMHMMEPLNQVSRTFNDDEVKRPIYKQCFTILKHMMKPTGSVKTIISHQPYPDVVVAVRTKVPIS